MTDRSGFHATEAETAYTIHVFNLIDTGGGCMAFEKPLNADGSRYMLVTHVDDAGVPDADPAPVRVGLYGHEHSEELDVFNASSAQDVADGIIVKGWK